MSKKKQTDYDAQIKVYTAKIGSGEASAENYKRRGIAYYFKEKYDDAIGDISNAIELIPEDEGCYYWRGCAYYKKAEYDKAIGDLTKAIKLDPENASNYYWRGCAYYEKAEYDKTIGDLTKAIKLDPENASNYYWRGCTYHEKAEYDDAIGDLTKAIKLGPENASNYHWRGGTYYEKKDYDRAIDDLTRAIDLRQDNGWDFYWRGKALLAKGKYSKAEKDLQKAEEFGVEISAITKKQIRDGKKKLRVLEEVKKVTQSVRGIIDEIKSRLEFQDGEVSHYTKISTAKALILNESDFRISHVSYLNDPSEGRTLLDFLDMKNPDEQNEKRYAFSPIFIGSFSKDPNALPLWRFYGDDAEGCSITFESNFLSKTTVLERIVDSDQSNHSQISKMSVKEEKVNNVELYQVAYFSDNDVYLEDKKNSELKKLFAKLKKEIEFFEIGKKYDSKNLADYLNEVSKYFRKRVHEELPNAISKLLNEIRYLIKSEHYRNEIEYRIIATEPDSKDINFDDKNRDGEIQLPTKCYVDLKADILKNVTRITIGPKVSRPEEKAAAFKTALLKAGNTTAEIYISTLPYK